MTNIKEALSTDERASHTPGPWRWEVNLKSRVISLHGGSRPLYDWTVMDFVRWGMGNAQPRFAVDGLLCEAENFVRVAPQREHHKEWFQLLSHPDADLIAAAPELLDALKELLASEMTLMPTYEAGKESQDAWADRRAAARNNAAFVIAKATGEHS